MITEEHITLIILMGITFVLGKMWQAQKEATQTSHIAFMAAFYACTEARGLKNSTVIQRIVEVYRPRSSDGVMHENAKKLQEEFEKMVNPEGEQMFDFMSPEHLHVDATLGRAANLDTDNLV